MDLYENILQFPGDSRQYEFNMKDFKLDHHIYNTIWGTVKCYHHIPTSKKVAIKTIRIYFDKLENGYNNCSSRLDEIKLHQSVSLSTHVVEFYGFSILDNRLLLCMEYMELSLADLSRLVHEHLGQFPEKFLGYIAVTIVKALYECQLRNIMHRDIKPYNIMMNWTGEIKLIDFGVSKCLTNSIAETFVGTVPYMPPERFKFDGNEYDNRADVWSLGITLLELVRGFNPYDGTGNVEINRTKPETVKVDKTRNGKIDELIKECFCSGCSLLYSHHLQSFIRSCLSEYKIRPRCEDLKRTPFYEFWSSISKDHMAKELKNIKQHADKVGKKGKGESINVFRNGATLLKVPFYNYPKILSNKFGELVQKLINTLAPMENNAAERNYMLKTLEHINPLNVTSYGGRLLSIPQCNNLNFPGNEQEYPFRIKDFDFIDHIFANTKSTIERYRHKNTGNTVVMKFVQIPDYNERGEDWSLEKVRGEIENHKILNGSLVIVNLYGFCVHGNYVIFVMESMDMSLTGLYQKWHRKHKSFPENLIGYICTRVINALLACRTNSIMHRDIKPHNILINRNGEVKLCDFGVSKLVPESVASTIVYTLEYCPPERIQNSGAPYGAESDVWSLGIAISEMARGKLPFEGLPGPRDSHYESILKRSICETGPEEIIAMSFGPEYSNDIKDFVRSCLKDVPNRASFQLLTETRFYQKHLSGNFGETLSVLNDFFIQEEDEQQKSQQPQQKSQQPVNNSIYLLFVLPILLFFAHYLLR